MRVSAQDSYRQLLKDSKQKRTIPQIRINNKLISQQLFKYLQGSPLFVYFVFYYCLLSFCCHIFIVYLYNYYWQKVMSNSYVMWYSITFTARDLFGSSIGRIHFYLFSLLRTSFFLRRMEILCKIRNTTMKSYFFDIMYLASYISSGFVVRCSQSNVKETANVLLFSTLPFLKKTLIILF